MDSQNDGAWVEHSITNSYTLKLISESETRSVITTIPHELHRKRRAALSPYFSPSNVRRLEPIIHESLKNLLGRLDSCQKSGQIVPMTVAYKAMTSDIITNYAFGKSTNYLVKDDFNISFFETIESVFEQAHCLLHIAWLGPMIEALPIPVVVKLIPEMGYMQKLKQVSFCRRLYARGVWLIDWISNGRIRFRKSSNPKTKKLA